MAKSPLKRALNTNPLLVRALWRWQCLQAERSKQQPVIVYQAGKVGSTAIVASLRSASAQFRIYHVHTLTEAGIKQRDAIYRNMIRQSRTTYFPRARHLMVSRYLRQQFKQRRQNPAEYQDHRWKVITLVREPVARHISSFFQTIDNEIPNFVQRYPSDPSLIEEAIRRFEQKPPPDEALTWFNEELHPALDIDVFAEPFPHAQGYRIYRTDVMDLLVLRLEDLQRVGSIALGEFLGIEVEIVEANEAASKSYADAYRIFRERLSLPTDYLEQTYSSKLAQHFYSVEELNTFRELWETKTISHSLA